jgi:hypothetical protein
VPKYPGAAGSFTLSPVPPTDLEPGIPLYLFGVLAATATALPVNDTNVVGETITAPEASIAFTVLGRPAGSPPPAMSFEFTFGGAPGAFNIQIQEADTDCDNAYITPTNAAYTTTAVTANNVARVDLIPTGGRFMRVLVTTLTNPVTLKAKATCLA